MSKKYLYYFSEGNDAFGGDKVTMKNTLGGKGAGLAEMTAAGMPVPQGFTITTDACTQYYADGRQINDEITADIFEHLKGLEEITGKKFGDNTNPLLVSVRSGARQSMPGMMDTILNLGLNDEAVEGLAKKTGNARFAYDCYRRFVQMFADVVMMVPKSLFEVEIDKMKEAKGVKNDVDLTAEDLKELVGVFKKDLRGERGQAVPPGSPRSADRGCQGRLPQLGQPPCKRLPQDERDSLRVGHRCQRAADGIRQLRRPFRHRRCIHP